MLMRSKLGLDLTRRMGGGGSAPAAPIMEVTGNGVTIANGDATPDAGDDTDFGSTPYATTVSKTYTINVTVAGVTGVNVLVPAGYTLVTPPDAAIAAGGSSTFTVRCDAGSVATLAGNITVESVELADYIFAITCTVTNTYYNHNLNTIAWDRWYRFRETSGTTAVNAMNSGTNDGTISGATLNQAGQLGAGEAFDFDGVDDFVSSPAGADMDGVLPATWKCLINPASRGEGNQARIWQKGNDFLRILETDGVSPFTVRIAVEFTGGLLLHNWADVLPENTWTLLHLRWNADNTVDLFVNGAKQTTTAAGSGTKSANANTTYIGNNAALSVTFDGLYDEWAFKGAAVSDANLLLDAQLAGVA